MMGSLDVLYSVLIQKLMAVYEEQEAQQRDVADTSLTPSPDLHQAELSVFQPITGGEIEVNSSALKSSTFVFSYFVLMLAMSSFAVNRV
ncbi:hypothetical protein ILYODFUR_007279 [Ilyodon furcidens]|uniref:Uncharacterized protein n=1 Tax=Ilyodon furcidens TaxID=33524 RepID=A0ABV0U591_9TELE